MAFAAALPALISAIPAIAQLFMNRKGGGTQEGSGGSLLSKPGQLKEFERFAPDQQELLSSLGPLLTGKGQGPTGGILGQLFSPEGFEAYAAPARREFYESTVPKLAEQFSGLGAQRSSAFQQQLAKAGEDLSTKLGEMRSQQQMSALGPLLSTFLTPRTTQMYQPEEPSIFAKGLAGIGQPLAKAGSQFLFDLIRSKYGGGGFKAPEVDYAQGAYSPIRR